LIHMDCVYSRLYESDMSKKVTIIGAGLAGLACAIELQNAGYEVQVYEKGGAAGGRVQSDYHEGFILDHGFQVLLTAYPECQRVLNYEALDLKRFKSGARIWLNDRFNDVLDPMRHSDAWVGSLVSPIGSLGDKIKVLSLSRGLKRKSLGEIFSAKEISTLNALKKRYGFSEKMISTFYRPFLAGIMLDPELTASSRMFEFVMKMFSEGEAAVPAKGMQSIPNQLLNMLKPGTVQLDTAVSEVASSELILQNRETVSFDQLVIATDNPSAILLNSKIENRGSKGVTTLYYALPSRSERDPILYLNGKGSGKINNLVFMSHLSNDYAPEGQDLAAISIISTGESETDLRSQSERELSDWFGNECSDWKFLRSYDIPHSQPDQTAPSLDPVHRNPKLAENIFAAGDYLSNASINGAMVSGRLAAEALQENQ